jgi:hypothetical protein
MGRRRAWYRDQAGELEGWMEVSDGFALEVGGVRFEGRSPDSLEPASHAPWADVGRFRLFGGDLCGCELEWSQGMGVIVGEREESGELLARLELGFPGERGGIDRADLALGLERGGRLLVGRGGYYEGALDQMRDGLEAGEHLRCCYGCGLSDYSPYGQGMAAGLMCFVDHAAAYYAIDEAEWAKDALFELIDAAAPLVWVVETHVCERFVPRRRGQGYRG